MSPAMIIVCLLAAPPGLTETIDTTDVPARDRPEWTATMQGGGGRLSEDPVALFRPRVTLTGQQTHLAVSVPLFLKLADSAPSRNTNGQPVTWNNNWRDGETYAAMIEELSYRSKHGAVDFKAGTLRRETLGHGTLIDDYTGSYDPSAPRSGARFIVTTDAVEARLLADGVIRPRLVAAGLSIAPFQVDDRDARDAFTVAFEVASDMRAPVNYGSTQVGGADVVFTGAPYIGDEMMVSLYFALGSFFTDAISGAMGSHVGTELAWSRGREALLLRLEGNVSGRGYDPAYFDDQYVAERNVVDPNSYTAKAERTAPSGYGARGRVEFVTGALTLGTSVEHSFASTATQRTRASLYGEMTTDMWHVAARVSQRAMRDGGDWFALGSSSMAAADASVRIQDEWFAFTLLHHGVRTGDNGLATPVSDWVIGVGYGVAGVL